MLPESSYDYATDKYGNKIIRIETFKPIKKDLCPTCEVLLNRLINLLPIASIDETYKISLIKEDKS